jgi:hypothetical protein
LPGSAVSFESARWRTPEAVLALFIKLKIFGTVIDFASISLLFAQRVFKVTENTATKLIKTFGDNFKVRGRDLPS